MEALDIFFDNKSIDKDNINIEAMHNASEVVISVCFTGLPKSIVIDTNIHTTFQDEYLLNAKGELEIIKKYSNTGKPRIFIKANQPTNPNCSELLTKKQNDLQKIITEFQIDDKNIDLRRSSEMRKAIYKHFSNDGQLKEIEIEVNKEDAKNIWDKLQKDLPIYFLFKSDRENSDKDNEVQDPLKIAVKEFLENDENIKHQLNNIAEQVKECISQVSAKTLEKLREIDENIANTLHPQINVDELKWQDVFKGISIAGDADIPINKRGSGIKRLVLFSFFRAKVEQKIMENHQSVIYAIEEPETSQHVNKQELLVQTLNKLSQNHNTQVIITTHSSVVVRNLSFDNLRIVVDNETGKSVENAKPGLLSYPSLNEINYLVFDDVSDAYHDELYSELEVQGLRKKFNEIQPKQEYIDSKNPTNPQMKSLTEIIRHQIHHPENKHNKGYKHEQKNSIELMRDFLLKNPVCSTKQ